MNTTKQEEAEDSIQTIWKELVRTMLLAATTTTTSTTEYEYDGDGDTTMDEEIWNALASSTRVNKCSLRSTTILWEKGQGILPTATMTTPSSFVVPQRNCTVHVYPVMDTSSVSPIILRSLTEREVLSNQEKKEQHHQGKYYRRLFLSFLLPVHTMKQSTAKETGDHIVFTVQCSLPNNDDDDDEYCCYYEMDQSSFWTLLGNARYTEHLLRGMILPLVSMLSPSYQSRISTTTVSLWNEDLPSWAREYFSIIQDQNFVTDQDRIQLAIDLSKRNIQQQGEPFASVIFRHDPSTQITTPYVIGVNTEMYHAETLALRLAYIKYHSHDEPNQSKDDTTTKKSSYSYWMYSSCEPCCTCLGGLIAMVATTTKAGGGFPLSKLVCAATKQDAESLGFDEGPVGDGTYQALQQVLGVTVIRGLHRDDSAAIIREYGEQQQQQQIIQK
ncbi:CMP/dCMP deaminase [Nitzschia inconspicua]|uniref:CMP/dCMP deaminase n=1 Tax=Nitzschia inconspicua TaxID=303405 RepID=A0A9K3LLB9_9STRA|nr:CMP/dCMP deaminase [Nitzschia inconspicua]